jgi:ATP-dependent DNA helicase RecG
MTLADFQSCIALREAEGIEFKPSLLGRKEIAEYAVGIGNAGGGYLIMGVTNKPPRQIQPVSPPPADEIQQIRRSVYDSAQIHIQVENLATPSGNVLIVPIPGRPRGHVFHTRDGKYLIRVGEDLRGMTLQEIDAIRQEAGVELTAQPLSGDWRLLIRAAGMEELRALMKEAGAPADLTRLDDADLLRALGLLTEQGELLLGGLLLVGTSEEIQRRLPHARWQFFRMLSDTDYEQPDGAYDCLTIALRRLRELVGARNPVVTIPGWLVHPEFPRYPLLALRELLVNALAHRDYTAPGTATVKQYPDRVEISNPGGFLADITPENILHHPSTPRYPALFGALARIRLANAANLGVPRVFRELLSEGKEPPYYATTGQTVIVTVKGQDARREFLELVRAHPGLNVDDLLIIHFLTRHREITARQAAQLCQRPLEAAREHLARLANQERLVESAGPSGRGRYYRLTSAAYQQLGQALAYHVDRRLTRENVKARLLATLETRDLTNSQVREITQLGREAVKRLMASLRQEGRLQVVGAGRARRWRLLPQLKP